MIEDEIEKYFLNAIKNKIHTYIYIVITSMYKVK